MEKEGKIEDGKRWRVLEECNSLIHEYLQRNQLFRTTQEFERECSELRLPIPRIIAESGSILSTSTYNKLLSDFDDLNEEQFFQVWDDQKLVPHEKSSRVFLKLNFKLHLYFAVRMIDFVSQSDSLPLKKMQDFLENEGNLLAEEQEFLHFYALPHVKDPKNHPTFKQLFQENWSSRLRCDLNEYIKSIREVCGESLLCRVVAVQCKELAGVQYTRLLQQYSSLREQHTKLIGVTTELTVGLEELARASLKPDQDPNLASPNTQWKKMIARCNTVFPELFSCSNPPPPTWSQKRALKNLQMQEKIEETKVSGSESSSSRLSYSAVLDQLDPAAIRDELQSHQTRTKLLLLQALRWMVTKSEPKERLQIVSFFQQEDILGFETSTDDQVFTCFVPRHKPSHLPHLMQQSLARLFNALASTGTGRNYLADHCALVDTLVDALLNSFEALESKTIEMVIATLQKLSLKCEVRKKLVSLGLVRWLGGVYLEDWERLRDYALEYTTALLMNLCLHRPGKEACVPIAEKLLKTLLTLISTDIKQIKPYVNGTLYSLLSNLEINQISRRLQVEDRLVELSETSDTETRQQIEYILEMVRGELREDIVQQDLSDDENEEGTEEDIEVETEIEENDSLVGRQDELTGLDFLLAGFTRAPAPTLQQQFDERPIEPKSGKYNFEDDCSGETKAPDSSPSIEPGDKLTENVDIRNPSAQTRDVRPSIKPGNAKNEDEEESKFSQGNKSKDDDDEKFSETSSASKDCSAANQEINSSSSSSQSDFGDTYVCNKDEISSLTGTDISSDVIDTESVQSDIRIKFATQHKFDEKDVDSVDIEVIPSDSTDTEPAPTLDEVEMSMKQDKVDAKKDLDCGIVSTGSNENVICIDNCSKETEKTFDNISFDIDMKENIDDESYQHSSPSNCTDHDKGSLSELENIEEVSNNHNFKKKCPKISAMKKDKDVKISCDKEDSTNLISPGNESLNKKFDGDERKSQYFLEKCEKDVDENSAKIFFQDKRYDLQNFDNGNLSTLSMEKRPNLTNLDSAGIQVEEISSQIRLSSSNPASHSDSEDVVIVRDEMYRMESTDHRAPLASDPTACTGERLLKKSCRKTPKRGKIEGSKEKMNEKRSRKVIQGGSRSSRRPTEHEAVESCDSGISMNEQRLVERAAKNPKSSRRQNNGNEKMKSNKQADVPYRLSSTGRGTYQYRSSQTEIKQRLEANPRQEAGTNQTKEKTEGKRSVQYPAPNRGFELRKIARSARSRSINARHCSNLQIQSPTVSSGLTRPMSSHVQSTEGRRTISMSFPYTPLSQIDCELALTTQTPRKCWRKISIGSASKVRP